MTTATMSNEELARRLGKGRKALVTAARTFCRTATPIAGKLAELEISILLGAAVEIAKEGKRTDYMITLFARLTGGQVSIATMEPAGLRAADNDSAAGAPQAVSPGPLACPHGVPLADLCPDCDQGAA